MDDSDEEYADFDETVDFELYEEFDQKQAAAKGGLKSYENKDNGGLVFYSDDESGFTVSVERLLCVDGWEDSSKKPEEMQAMTLIVLKLVLACNDPDGRIKYVRATMTFEDTKKGEKANPDLEAWAPFQEMVRSNAVKLDTKKKSKQSAKVGAKAFGGNISVSASGEKEISWTQTYFDEGNAYPVMGEKGRRSGARWVLKTHELETTSVPPEIWVAMLLKRDTDAPYVVKFQIQVGGGLLHQMGQGIKKVLGLGPGVTKPFISIPSASPKIRYEGHDIIGGVDPANLGKLKTKGELGKLTLVWGQKDEPKPDENAGEKAEGEEVAKGEEEENLDDDDDEDDDEDDEEDREEY